MKQAKIGRPPKRAQLKRTRRLQLLLTAAEYRALSKYADARHMAVSEVIRGAVRSLLEQSRGEE
jgi:hypothetical protein